MKALLKTIERVSTQLDNLTEMVLRSEGWTRSPGHFGWFNTKTEQIVSDVIYVEDLLHYLKDNK